MKKIFILFFCLILVINSSESLKCGKEYIENCAKCGIGEKADTCIECKPKHFLFLIIYYVLHVMVMIKFMGKLDVEEIVIVQIIL